MSSVRDLFATVEINSDFQALLSLNSAMDGIESTLSGMGGHLDSTLSNFNQLGNAGSNAMDEITGGADGALDSVDDLENAIDDVEDSLGDMGGPLDDAIDDFDNLGDNGSDAMDEIEDAADDATDSVDDLGNEFNNTEQQGTNAAGGIGKSFKSLIGVLAAVFAVDKIKDFGVSLIESAAEASAMSAQYEQVFGDMQGGATATIDGMGKEFGMVSERLKPAFTQMTSMFKGLGMDTEQSMGQAEKAVTLSADAAAFYDKSYEDANSALNSFIKGNYEGGEAIGLFGNETQLSSWASKELGIEWKTLDEAGKQVARLEFAKTMQEAAGATGQAARESDGYQNVLGNLKQNWTNLKAKLGDRILEPAIEGLKGLSEWVGNVDVNAILDGFGAFGSYMSGTFGPVLEDAKSFISAIWDEFERNGGIELAGDALDGVKEGLAWLKDNSGVITAALAGVVGAFAAFHIITGVSTAIGVFNTLMIAMKTGTLMATLAQYGLNTALLANPITWVVVGIGLLIAAGVLLYKNWDTVKLKLGELWVKVQDIFGKIYDWGANKIKPVADFFKGLSDKFKSFKDAISSFKVPGWVSTIGGAIGNAAGKVGNLIDGSHETGLDFVPWDNYVAQLHKGERVLTAEENEEYSGGDAPSNNSNFGVSGGGASGSTTFAPQYSIVIEGGNGDANEIAEKTRQVVREENEKFWRKMTLAQV